jgi:hypothetical protein
MSFERISSVLKNRGGFAAESTFDKKVGRGARGKHTYFPSKVKASPYREKIS